MIQVFTGKHSQFIGDRGITLSELKQQLNVEEEYTDDNLLLETFLGTAVEAIENMINGHIQHKEIIQEIDLEKGNTFYFPIAPLVSIQGVKAINPDNQEWETVSVVYELTERYNGFILKFASLPSNTPSKLQITYEVGYPSNEIPKPLKQAILVQAADFYDSERSGYTASGLQKTNLVERLVSPYIRCYW
ncbi:phage gp6-like head-tail connector protein [Halosquirtibacter xylanolyticus]|uniref:head-tail connector protein n=1 Tax=Halosquirtibacter xylanolyticus TaxID=3374599 RepID=UPI003748A79C|nr:phage gp6-like head-tail connector protein [Prolixibacteraceae bacterium]